MITGHRRKCCLVLEGGGVKCSYQYGALMTLVNKYGSIQDAVETLCGGAEFKGVAGASFGALNSAMLLAGGMEKLEEFWKNISAEAIFHEPRLQELMEKIYRRQKVFDLSTVLFALSGGLDPFAKQNEISGLYYDFVKKNVDEAAVRESGLELGITVVELADFGIQTDKLSKIPFKITNEDLSLLPNVTRIMGQKLVELDLFDIGRGLLPEYVAASAAFPAFKPVHIDDKYYTDGGVLDNIPVRMMEERGFDSALVIRTGVNEPKKRWSNDIDVRFITPTRELGAAAIFSVDNVRETIALGEYDAGEFLKLLP